MKLAVQLLLLVLLPLVSKAQMQNDSARKVMLPSPVSVTHIAVDDSLSKDIRELAVEIRKYFAKQNEPQKITTKFVLDRTERIVTIVSLIISIIAAVVALVSKKRNDKKSENNLLPAVFALAFLFFILVALMFVLQQWLSTLVTSFVSIAAVVLLGFYVRLQYLKYYDGKKRTGWDE